MVPHILGAMKRVKLILVTDRQKGTDKKNQRTGMAPVRVYAIKASKKITTTESRARVYLPSIHMSVD